MPRRSIPNPLETTSEPRWLVVRDRCSRPVRSVMLAPRTDLRAALAAEWDRLVAEGWRVDEPTRYAFLFAQNGTERVCISIEHYAPGDVPVGHGSRIGKKPSNP